MVPDSQPRRLLPTAALLAFVVVVAIAAAGRSVLLDAPIHEQGDIAANALQVENARRFAEIYGNYSRFEFNHPGPAFFYCYAAAELVLYDLLGVVPSPHNAHLLCSLVLQAGFFALALAIAVQWLRSPWFLAGAVLFASWHFTRVQGPFNSLWPPHVLLMPALCLLAASASFAAGRTRHLAVMVVAGGFLFHGHVAQPLFVGGLGLVALALHLHARRIGPAAWFRGLWSENRSLAAGCAGWILLFLLPVAIDLVRYGGESNVATILARLRANTEEGKGLLQAFLYFVSFATAATDQEEVFTRLGPATVAFFRSHALAVLLWAAALAGPLALLLRRRDRWPDGARAFLTRGYAVLGATVVLCVVWGLLQAGPMFQFNGFFFYGVYYFGAMLGLGVVTSAWPLPAKPAVLAATLCLAVIGFTRGFELAPLSRTDAGRDIQEAVERLVRSEGRSPRPKILVFEHHLWPDAVSVALELTRRGVPFHVAHTWNFMFSRRHDLRLLGDAPTARADVWWVRPSGDLEIKPGMALATRPAEVEPRGTTWSFGEKENGFRHVVSGLSTGNIDSAFAEEPVVRFQFAPRSTTDDVQIILDAAIAAGTGGPTQEMEVRFNGRFLGRAGIGARTQSSFVVPAALWNSLPVATFEVRLPEATALRDAVRPARGVWTSIQLWRVWFTSQPSPAAGPGLGPRLALAPSPFTTTIDPAGDRLDFTPSGRGRLVARTGFGPLGDGETRLEGGHAVFLVGALPAERDVLVELVARPWSEEEGRPAHQRCRLRFNGHLLFDAPFTEPGVLRVVIPRALWNEHRTAVFSLELPDASPPGAPGPARGLAVRWLTAQPVEPQGAN